MTFIFSRFEAAIFSMSTHAADAPAAHATPTICRELLRRGRLRQASPRLRNSRLDVSLEDDAAYA